MVLNPFMLTVPTFAVRETSVSRTANVGTVGKNWLTGGSAWAFSFFTLLCNANKFMYSVYVTDIKEYVVVQTNIYIYI